GEQPDVLPQVLDRVLELTLVSLNRAEELARRHDLGWLPLEEGGLRGAWPVALIQFLDQVGHPAAEALEEANAELGEEVEHSTGDQGRQRVHAAQAVVERVGCVDPWGEGGTLRPAMDPDRQVQVL